MKYTVRVSGTAPVWADVEVEADSPQAALDKVDNGDAEICIAFEAKWEFCEGGGGVDDWTTTGDVYDADGEGVMEDGELVMEDSDE